MRHKAWTLDFLLPPRCPQCGETVLRQADLCAACWRGLLFIQPPFCFVCGLPLSDGVHAGGVYDDKAVCAACLSDPPPFAHARSAVRYDAESRGLLIAFKHFDRCDLVPVFARWLNPVLHRLRAEVGTIDAVVPVPLHRFRLWRRRYNQAALIARFLAVQIGTECSRADSMQRIFRPDLLHRKRATPSQGQLTRRGRLLNVAGAFRVNPQAKAALEGKTILLVDDVMTTGATVSACARALATAGVGRVLVITVARVL